MSDDLHTLLDGDGRPLGTRVSSGLLRKLHALVATVLADVLGAPTDFESHPTTVARVSYRVGESLIPLLCVSADPTFQQVRLQLHGLPAELLEPLAEPRYRLARKVEAFVAAALRERERLEAELAPARYVPRRLRLEECGAQCAGGCFVMEPVE